MLQEKMSVKLDRGQSGYQLIHVATPASQVPRLMVDLFDWLQHSLEHPLIRSCIFHYAFEFIHPFSDGNRCIGRLWQTLILSEWQTILANIPIESLIHQNQQQYYLAINQSTQQSDSAPFILFMLNMINDALSHQVNIQNTPQVTHQVTPQVEALLRCIEGDMSRDKLQKILGLKDQSSFKDRYLQPALQANLIEMTVPEKPSSCLQKYRLTQTGQQLKSALLHS